MQSIFRPLVSFAFAGISMVALLAGCDDSDSGGGGGNSLAGTVRGPTGAGLPGVVVEVISPSKTAQAVTDADGNFVVLKPPTGLVDLHIDGTNAPGGIFPTLELSLVVGGGASNLSQPIVLPDLSAGTTVAVDVDANGVTSGANTVVAPDGSTLGIPDMTTILLDGAPPADDHVEINVTPVPAINVPMPLPGNQDPGAFVTIQPPNASFNPALDITLPNIRNLPPGTMVDIWSFDHQEGAWVNRSEETGNQGTVSLDGLFIVATGVITEGGWHAGAVPVDPACATTLEGRVFTLGSPDTLEDVLISLSTGQFAVTDGGGRFSIPMVPAYDASMLPVCLASDIELRASAPVSFGAMTLEMTISSKDIVTGGTTDLGDFDIPVTTSGTLVGSVIQGGEGVEGTVTITGTEETTAESDSNGSFFVATLEPGDYTASFDFAGGTESKDFKITAHKTTVVNLKGSGPSGGGGDGELEVRVRDFSANDGGSGLPVEDACVTLQGSTGAPLFATTDANGVATFDDVPDGPYTVTAQKDTTLGFGTGRLATSVVDVEASGSNPAVISIPVFAAEFLPPVVPDATLQGTILNDPGGVTFHYLLVSSPAVGFEASGDDVGTEFEVMYPGDMDLDLVVYSRDMVTGEVAGAIFHELNEPPQTTHQDEFDFDEACNFVFPVDITYNNVSKTHTDFSADLEFRNVGDLDLSHPLDEGSLPATVHWPDFSANKLAAYDKFFDVGSTAFGLTFEGSFCEVPLGNSTPTMLTVDFLGTPTIQEPENNAMLPTFGPGDTVEFTLGSGSSSTSGFNSIIFVGEADPFTFWEIIVPPGETHVTIPEVFANKPMFTDGFYGMTAGAVRFDFPGFDYANFFDENIATNIAAIFESEVCDAEQSSFFIVGTPPTAPNEEARARLVRRVPLAVNGGAR